ncbi:MAG: tetratricopeptide repeat protein, partial [Bacteroidia bacterium]|nr:tetratricopeptide repeat protein [Bacteroidia bacterium]
MADSLKALGSKGFDNDSIYLNRLRLISSNDTDPAIQEFFADSLISEATRRNKTGLLHSGYLQKGNSNRLMGNYGKALESFFQAAEIGIQLDDPIKEGSLYGSIADVYSVSGDEENAIKYYNQSIETLRQTTDTVSLSTALYNTGDEYINQGKYDLALSYFEEAIPLFDHMDFTIGTAYCRGNIGIVYASQDEFNLAEVNLNAAINTLEEYEDYYAISAFLFSMSEIFHEKHDHPEALKYAHQAMDLAEKYDLKEQVVDASQQLYKLYKHMDQPDRALEYHEIFKSVEDTIFSVEKARDLANQKTDFEIGIKQAEVDLLEEQKKSQRITIIATLITLGLICIMAIGLFRRNRFIKKTNAIIHAEKEKSDNLLLNILPEETADELKEFGKVEARKYESVTVLFTDFKGFTRFSENLDPAELVKSIDMYFSKFDEIIEKYDIEKIKTIGDAYMCAGGLPHPTEDHAERCVMAAQEIIKVMYDIKENSPPGVTALDIRIGINTG